MVITSLECPHAYCSQKLRGQFHQNTWTCLDYSGTRLLNLDLKQLPGYEKQTKSL